MDDAILIETILEAQAILARHVSGEHASADDTIANLFKLFDSADLVEEIRRGTYQHRSGHTRTEGSFINPQWPVLGWGVAGSGQYPPLH
jgi:hypothetical protein